MTQNCNFVWKQPVLIENPKKINNPTSIFPLKVNIKIWNSSPGRRTAYSSLQTQQQTEHKSAKIDVNFNTEKQNRRASEENSENEKPFPVRILQLIS